MNINELTLLQRFGQYGLTEQDLYELKRETVTGTVSTIRMSLEMVKMGPAEVQGIALALQLVEAVELELLTRSVLAKAMGK